MVREGGLVGSLKGERVEWVKRCLYTFMGGGVWLWWAVGLEDVLWAAVGVVDGWAA